MMVVPDTNIRLSALLFGGKPKQAVLRAVEQDMIATCQEIIMEVIAVAARKFSEREDQLMRDFRILLANVLVVEVKGAVQACRDPKDNMVLECARNASASLIITGDKDLLMLGSFEGIRIITASQYVEGTASIAVQP